MGKKVNKQKKIYKFFNRVYNHPIFKFISVISIIIALFVTIRGLYTDAYNEFKNSNYYTNTESYKKDQYKILNKLSTEVNINEFKANLGNEKFLNVNKETSNKEYIFINKYYDCQVITTSNDKVLLFSITSKNKDFNPIFESPGIEIWVQLGVTKFADLKQKPIYFEGFDGARRFFYKEAYYLGNPGFYQTYILSLNDAGYEEIIDWSVFGKKEQPGFDNPKLKTFREKNTINTFSTLAPFLGWDCKSIGDIEKKLGFQIGVDLDEVRLLEYK